MARISSLLYALAATTFFYVNQSFAQRSDGQYWPCNPMKNVTCPPNPGLSTYSYTVDFTNPPSDLSNYWSTSNYANITYNTLGNNGAEFTFHKRYDAPQLFTNFYIFFGRVDITMQVAPGQGIISSGVLISDDFDEIDWEMSGNNFAFSQSTVQNNYFSKGITGSYDRGQWVQTPNPQTQFHTYSFDWTPTQLQWLVDGKVVRTFLASQADAGTHQFPQTPSKIQLGLWDGGDPSESGGTISWAGGLTDLNAGPYTMFVKSVSVKNYNPAKFYNWTDQTGSWKSIKPLNTSLPTTSSASATGSASSAASSTSTSILPPKAVSISQNGLCGASNPFLCQGSAFGDCCSFYGFCGNSTEYCGNGCQADYGLCGDLLGHVASSVGSSVSATSTSAVGSSVASISAAGSTSIVSSTAVVPSSSVAAPSAAVPSAAASFTSQLSTAASMTTKVATTSSVKSTGQTSVAPLPAPVATTAANGWNWGWGWNNQQGNNNNNNHWGGGGIQNGGWGGWRGGWLL